MAVLRISGIVRVCLGILAKFKRIRRWLVAPVLPTHEKRSGDKRVESRFTLRLDEGSIPSSSTKTILQAFVDELLARLFFC